MCTVMQSERSSTHAGDLGPTISYLTGGVAILVLAIGSTAPGLLTFATDKVGQVRHCSQSVPDEQTCIGRLNSVTL